jgi:X-Pro dipeptidyl-peptidase
LLGAVAAAAALSSFAVAGHSSARADATTTACTPDPALDSLDPCQYDYSQAIVSHIQVPVPTTTVDAVSPPPGGAPAIDNIWVDYIRPAVPAGAVVPTIMDASPYFNTLGRGYDSILKTPFDPTAPTAPVGVERCTTCPTAPFPEWEAHYFVPRGYAIALMDLRGTRNSSGCEVYGDKQEALDAVAVIDWIASQSWSNGKVGMIGGSYDGTMANGAAALYPIYGQHHYPDGTDALAAVVPIRAIDRWYDYQFFNGVEANGQELDPELFTAELPTEDWPNSGPNQAGGDPNYAADLAQRKACPLIQQVPTDAGYSSVYQDTKDAGTTNFWNSRDYLQYTSTWKAATLFIHGLYDNNVKTMNSGQLWQALPASVPKRYLWFNGAHADPDTPTVAQEVPNDYFMPFTFMQKFEHEVHQWYLQYLKGVDAGAALAPRVEIQRDYADPSGDGHWDAVSQYPADPTYSNDHVLHFTPDGHAQTAPAAAGSVQWDDSGGVANAAQGTPLSQSFVTDPFAADTRVSGQFQFDINVAAQGLDTTIAVEVDDVPPGALNDATFATQNVSTNKDPFAFTYGYIRPFYRDSIKPRGSSYPTNGAPMQPNTQYAMSFPSTYMDYVVRAGHQLRFTFSDASPYSIATDQGFIVTMSTGATGGLSQVRVPESAALPPNDTPDLAQGLLGAGGPVVAIGVGLAAAAMVRRRRRQHS